MKSLILALLFLGSTLNVFAEKNPSTSSEITTVEVVDYVEFTLHNKSLKSIPLIIPNVMNPNLSPVSNSGVSLKIGQEILFKYRGKKRVLLVVTPDLEGKTLDVSKLLKERKKELDEKRK